MAKKRHFPYPSHLLRLKASRVAKKGILRGLAYLIELASNPNEWVHCSKLRNIFNQPGKGSEELETAYQNEEAKDHFISIGSFELPIEAIDAKTLTSIRKRLVYLICQEDIAKEWNNLARLDEILDEKEKLLDYLDGSVSSHGNIKVINSQSHADYRAVYKAIHRALDIIKEEEPELVDDIQEHLVTGIHFMWKEAV